MKLILAMILMLFSLNSFSGEGTGVGFMLGNPTGLNAKHWLNSSQAVDGAIGFSLGRTTNFSIHSDYLFHKAGAFYFNDVHPLDLYYGLGGRMEFDDQMDLGLRVPIGLVHQLDNDSADIFAEVAPILDFIGRNGVEVHLAIGG